MNKKQCDHTWECSCDTCAAVRAAGRKRWQNGIGVEWKIKGVPSIPRRPRSVKPCEGQLNLFDEEGTDVS